MMSFSAGFPNVLNYIAARRMAGCVRLTGYQHNMEEDFRTPSIKEWRW
jgi:hypothetical protein